MTIRFYKPNDLYGFLSNFTKTPMFIYDRIWDNAEAPYQFSKAICKEDGDAIWACETPREARDLGQTIKMREDWEQVKDQMMFECVMAKFLQHPNLRKKLVVTINQEIIEDSPVDSYWGCGPNGYGQNKLGKILMAVREKLYYL